MILFTLWCATCKRAIGHVELEGASDETIRRFQCRACRTVRT